MSRPQPPTFARKSSAPWDRLRPIKQDPLEAMGYVSKGDNRLLDIKTQEIFYQKIVARYMQFCTQHKKNLDAAFASLSLIDYTPNSSDPTRNPPNVVPQGVQHGNKSQLMPQGLSASKWATDHTSETSLPEPSEELSTILMALRKLREGLLATSASADSPIFSQRVHIFNIRVAILALHAPSYHPSLSYLLTVLHTKKHPLPDSELKEMTTYMILDLALRQNDLIAAYALKHNSQKGLDHKSNPLDTILRAVTTDNWVAFWKVRRQVDGYIRAMMHWHTASLRKSTLKTFGRAYLKVDVKWLLKSTTGNEMSWEEMITKENVGWALEGQTVIIRKSKTKA